MIWAFLGRDIFVSPEGVDEVNIEGDKIMVMDWNHDLYYLDYNGRQIRDKHGDQML